MHDVVLLKEEAVEKEIPGNTRPVAEEVSRKSAARTRPTQPGSVLSIVSTIFTKAARHL